MEEAASDDRLLRLAADFDNYKKRAARERQEYVALANERIVKELLPVLDDLERALTAAEQHEEAQLEEGVRLVHRSLATLLERNGLTEIDADGQVRPARPRGAARAARGGPEQGDVLDVIQKGYKLGDRVVRPARVIVAEWRWQDPLRHARRREDRVAGRDQEGVPQARARAPSRPQPGRRRRGGALQGGAAGVRRALRRGEAQAVRPLRRAERARRRRRRAQNFDFDFDFTSATSATSSAGSSAAGRAGGSARSTASRCAAPTSRREVRLSFEDSLRGAEAKVPVELTVACHDAAAPARSPARRRSSAPSATAAASSPSRRGSSRSRSRARAAAATAP